MIKFEYNAGSGVIYGLTTIEEQEAFILDDYDKCTVSELYNLTKNRQQEDDVFISEQIRK